MKTLLIAAAATAAVAALGAALPASAQTWDRGGHAVQVQVRPVQARFDRDDHGHYLSPWEIRRLEARRLEERRRIEWLRHHHPFHEGYRDSGYGYRR